LDHTDHHLVHHDVHSVYPAVVVYK
jgi:hypothetical protein